MYNVDIRIVRIFNTYGPNMDKNDGRVVTKLISQILTNEDITIYGDGSQTRSFCYIDDLLEGLIRLMSSKYNYPMNIGNSSDITIKELSNILLDLIDSESNINQDHESSKTKIINSFFKLKENTTTIIEYPKNNNNPLGL